MKITEKTKPVERIFNIELTEKELKVLASLAGNVSGEQKGPRGVTNQLYDFAKKVRLKVKFLGHIYSLPNTWEEWNKLHEV